MNPNRNADVPIGINPPQRLRRQSTIQNPKSVPQSKI
jgi:hypothetical protein